VRAGGAGRVGETVLVISWRAAPGRDESGKRLRANKFALTHSSESCAARHHEHGRCTRIRGNESFIQSARATKGQMTRVSSPEPCKRVAVRLTGRFELNGDTSIADFRSDYTPHCTGPRSFADVGPKLFLTVSSVYRVAR
jgi:hypothetical protein